MHATIYNIILYDVQTGRCAINLINDGVTINDKNVTIEFTSFSSASLYHCKLNGIGRSTYCRSPLRYFNLRPGPHSIDIEPIGCRVGRQERLAVQFDI